MRRLHKLTERAIVTAVKFTSDTIRTLYAGVARIAYWCYVPIRELSIYLWFVVCTIYKRYAYEWYLLFTVNTVWMGVLGYVTIPKIVKKIEITEQAPISEVISTKTKDYLYQLDTWPFTAIRSYSKKVETLNAELIDYKFAAGEVPIPLEQVIIKEAYRAGVPEDIAFAIVAQENGKKDPLAFFAGNRNRTLDTGVMQVNSSNFKQCGISIVEAFNPKKNIECGMNILRDAYNQAVDMIKERRRPKSCTNARNDQDLLLEYTGRIYNGGAGVFSKGDTSCKYAMNLRRKYAGLAPIDYEEVVLDQVALPEMEDKEETGFWAWLF